MHTDRLASLLAPAFVCVTLGIACAPPPPAPPPAAPIASSFASAAPPAPAEEALLPGELRCGIDDGPVPIGSLPGGLRRKASAAHRADLQPENAAIDGNLLAKRMMVEEFEFSPIVDAAKARATTRWVLGEGVATAGAFEARAGACRDLADVSDAGPHAFSVRVAAGGGPLSVRPVGSAEPTKYTTCLAASLCALGSQAQGTVARRMEARFETSITPPVFTGTVSLSFSGDRTGKAVSRGPVLVRNHTRGRRGPVRPPEPPPTPADLAYVAAMARAAQPGALACAKRTPPGGELFVSTRALTPQAAASPYKKIDMAMPPPTPPMQRAAAEYHRQMTACVTEAVEAVLLAPPKSFSTTGKVFASATFRPGAEGPPAATP